MPTDAKKTDTNSQKPDIVTQPQSAPVSEPPVQTSSQASVPQGGELTPVETKPAEKPVTTAKQQQPAAPKPAAAAPKPKQDKAKLLEKIATQN